MLWVEPSPQSEVRALCSGFSSSMPLFMAAFIFLSILTGLSVLAVAKHPHTMMLPPPCVTVVMVMSCACFLQTLLASTPENLVCLLNVKNTPKIKLQNTKKSYNDSVTDESVIATEKPEALRLKYSLLEFRGDSAHFCIAISFIGQMQFGCLYNREHLFLDFFVYKTTKISN